MFSGLLGTTRQDIFLQVFIKIESFGEVHRIFVRLEQRNRNSHNFSTQVRLFSRFLSSALLQQFA